jgi:alkylation response protein AidB-like acyl-CoA dehydrogenase
MDSVDHSQCSTTPTTVAKSDDLIAQAVRLADDHLFPSALKVDESGSVPTGQLDRLAAAGMHSIFSPVDCGGLGVDQSTILKILETIAGGCLTTAFVWTQHAGACRAAAGSAGPMRDSWAHSLATGEARGGVAFAHLLRPGTPLIQADPVDGGWTFTGTAPFVSGWGHIDVVLTAARHGDDIIWALLDAADSTTLTSKRLRLAAVDSTVTAELTFEDHTVPGDQVTHIESFDDWYSNYRTGLRTNGSLALGVTSRILRLLGPSSIDEDLARAREWLDTASLDDMPAARANMTSLGVAASAALVSSIGGSAMMADHQAQRLAREALFLLVQGQTPEIKRRHVERFTRQSRST